MKQKLFKKYEGKNCCWFHEWLNRIPTKKPRYIFFCQIATFKKVCMAFVNGLQTLY